MEMTVSLVQRWILFRLRKRKFFSLSELNVAIRTLLNELNHRSFTKREGSRFGCWQDNERPMLSELPAQRYELAEWGKTRAGPDYLAQIDGHSYSVPYEKRNQEFEYRLTQHSVEILQMGNSVASHSRCRTPSDIRISPHHRPPAHNAVAGWSREKALEWAASVGPATEGRLEALLQVVRGPFSGYRTTCAMQAIAKNCGNARMESVCSYAEAFNIKATAEIRNILNKGLDLLPREADQEPPGIPIEHGNIRGPITTTML